MLNNYPRTFQTNTLSHYRLNSLFLHSLLSVSSGGTLITVSSVLGHLGASQLSAYTASKAALLAFHRSLTAELATTNANIKTILVTPGQLSTDMFGDVQLGWLARFLGPVVEVKDLAMKIVRMVDDGNGGVISEPAYTRWIAVLDLLPVGLQKLVREWTGVDTAMGGQRTEAAQFESKRTSHQESGKN